VPCGYTPPGPNPAAPVAIRGPAAYLLTSGCFRTAASDALGRCVARSNERLGMTTDKIILAAVSGAEI
jgi:hypothetical protein